MGAGCSYYVCFSILRRHNSNFRLAAPLHWSFNHSVVADTSFVVLFILSLVIWLSYVAAWCSLLVGCFLFVREYKSLSFCPKLPVQVLVVGCCVALLHLTISVMGFIGRLRIRRRLSFESHAFGDMAIWLCVPALGLLQEAREIALVLKRYASVNEEKKSLIEPSSDSSGETFIQPDVVYTGITAYPVLVTDRVAQYPNLP
jgi:Cys-rich protein (TIGR01571 family)